MVNNTELRKSGVSRAIQYPPTTVPNFMGWGHYEMGIFSRGGGLNLIQLTR